MDSKLTITVLDEAVIGNERGDLPREITAQFNPTELTLQKAAQIAEQNIPGLDSPVLQFVRGQSERLSVELILDDGSLPAEGMSVAERMAALYQLAKIQPETHAVPRINVTWGSSLSMNAVTESVQRKLTLFDHEGAVRRAVVSVVFREYRELEEQLRELKLESAEHTLLRVLREGDRLDQLAYEKYGEADLWRELARYNEVSDPRVLVPGTMIQLPPREELSRGGVR